MNFENARDLEADRIKCLFGGSSRTHRLSWPIHRQPAILPPKSHRHIATRPVNCHSFLSSKTHFQTLTLLTTKRAAANRRPTNDSVRINIVCAVEKLECKHFLFHFVSTIAWHQTLKYFFWMRSYFMGLVGADWATIGWLLDGRGVEVSVCLLESEFGMKNRLFLVDC